MACYRNSGLDTEAVSREDQQQQISERVGDFIPGEPVRRDLALQIENREIHFPRELVALLGIIAVNMPTERQTETQCAIADLGVA
jgi:hypothetical protein